MEFGLNSDKKHLQDDIIRLCHEKSNIDKCFAVHLYRLSSKPGRISARDLPPRSKSICSREQIQEMLKDCQTKGNVEVFYGMADGTNTFQRGLWIITRDRIAPVFLIKNVISALP